VDPGWDGGALQAEAPFTAERLLGNNYVEDYIEL